MADKLNYQPMRMPFKPPCFQPIQPASTPFALQYLPVNVDQWLDYPTQLLSLKRPHIPILNMIPHGLPSNPGLVNQIHIYFPNPTIIPKNVVRADTPVVLTVSSRPL